MKSIRVISMSYCAIDAQHTTPWEDIWLIFKDRRKTRRYGPCIISYTHLENDLAHNKEMRDEHLAKIQTEESELVEFCDIKFEVHHQSMIDSYSWTIQTYESAKAELEAGADYVILDDQDLKNGCPNIITKASDLNRQVIEDALEWFLRQNRYLKPKSILHFKWKRPSLFIMARSH